MSTTAILFVAAAAMIFFIVVFLVVMGAGTRLTGKQIDEDPDARSAVEPDKREDDFPIDAEF